MSSSDTFTFQAIDGRGVDPRTLQLPTLLSVDAFIAAVEECCPTLPPSIDDFARTPDLVPDDGSSQSSSSPSCSPQARAYTYLPQEGHIDPGLLRHPTTPASSNSPSHRVRVLRVLIEAPCAGGVPLKQNDWSFCCSVCGDRFGRRDEAKRHIDTAGMRVQCSFGLLVKRRDALPTNVARKTPSTTKATTNTHSWLADMDVQIRTKKAQERKEEEENLITPGNIGGADYGVRCHLPHPSGLACDAARPELQRR
ncbi:hypothetical protein BJ322DRAFT_1023069 [Thelephora terrestris]|uniref:C2H2-type domain-containing protein n=1 Tax=Thelephora terrestris TaxID=56493 RepID=A0A9P6H8F3_9AGAM|nr:hypothetical protein BJ322DRAFT_1023069 [Thelephora terrestris]